MAVVEQTRYVYTGDGVTREFPIVFRYLRDSDVIVQVNGQDVAYTFSQGNSFVRLADVPSAGAEIVVQRSTEARYPLHEFQHGSPLVPGYLDENFKQVLHVAQEVVTTSEETRTISESAFQTAQDALVVTSGYADGILRAVDAATDAAAAANAAAAAVSTIEDTANQAAADASTALSVAQGLESDITLRQDLANPDKGAAMVARGVVAVDSIADLLALPEEHRRRDLCYLVRGFYEDNNNLGGGQFYWDEEHPKETADGGVCIDPTALGGFDGTPSTYVDLLKAQGSGTGIGCWVRNIVDGKVRPSYFGYLPNNPESGLVAVWAACRYGRNSTGVHIALDDVDLVTSPTNTLPALGLGALRSGTSGTFIEGLDNLTIEIPSGKTWKLNGSFDFNFRPKGIGRYAGHKNLKIYGGGSFSGGTGRPFICFNLAHVTNVTVLGITFDECTDGHTFDVMGCSNLLFRDCKWVGSTLDFSTNRYNKEAIQFDVTGDGSRRHRVAADNSYLDYVGNRHVRIQDCQWKPKLNPDGSVSSYSVRPFGNHGSGHVDVDRDVVIEGCYIEAAHPAEGLYSKAGSLLEFNVIDGLVIRNNTIVLNHCPYYLVIYFREAVSGLLYDESTSSLVTAPMPTRLPCPKFEGNHIEYNISGRVPGEAMSTKLIGGTGVHILNNTVNTNIAAGEATTRHSEVPALYRMLNSTPTSTHPNYLNEVIIRGNKVHGAIREFGGLTSDFAPGRPPLELYEISNNFFEMVSTTVTVAARVKAINVLNNYIGLDAWNYSGGGSVLTTLNGDFVRVTGNTVGPKRRGETRDNFFVRERGVTGSVNVIISENMSADSIGQNATIPAIKKYNNYNIGDVDSLVPASQVL